MRSTLFHIPREIGTYPVFGFGVLLFAWLLFSLVLLVLMWRRHGLAMDWFSYLLLVVPVALVIWQVLPRLCHAEGLPIRSYGVMMLLAIVSGTGLAAWRAKRRGLAPEVVFSLAFWLFVPGIVGARAFYVIEYWDTHFWPVYQAQGLGALIGATINVAEGGLVVYGSLIGGVVGFALFEWKHRLPVLAFGDLLAPSLVLGLALGRIGCFLNGCCFGGACDLPWAVTFPAGSPPYSHQAQHGHIPLHGLMLAESGPGEVRVEQVLPDSAAEQSGLTAGDRLLSINGVPLETARGTAAGSLRQARWVLASANEMRLLIELGEDATGTTQYTHWSLPIPGNADDTLYETGPDDLYLHGLTLRDDAEGGVRIDAVRHGTPAAARGIPPGSHLTAIQGRPVHALIDVQRLLNEFVEQPWIQVRTAENDLPRWPIHPSGTRSAPVHPTQLYSAINAALLCLLLLAYEPFRRRDGELIALDLTIYPVTRYLLEAIRTDESAVFGTGLSISQNVSIGILAAAGLLWWYVLTRPPGTKRFDGYATPGKPDR